MKAFVDRIESGIATLLIGEQETISVNIPVDMLPDNIREGMVVFISVEIDLQETYKVKDEIRAMRDSLLKDQ